MFARWCRNTTPSAWPVNYCFTFLAPSWTHLWVEYLNWKLLTQHFMLNYLLTASFEWWPSLHLIAEDLGLSCGAHVSRILCNVFSNINCICSIISHVFVLLPLCHTFGSWTCSLFLVLPAFMLGCVFPRHLPAVSCKMFISLMEYSIYWGFCFLSNLSLFEVRSLVS